MDFFNPLSTSFFMVVGMAIIVLFVLPGRQRIPVFTEEGRVSLQTRIRQKLYAAGIFDEAPIFLVLILAFVSVVAGLFFASFFSFGLAFLLGPLLVAFSTYYYLNRREKAYIQRASDELVPFLNRIAAAVGAGQPMRQAYLDAVEDSQWLREPLEDSAARISSGEAFSTSLLETLPLLPLRMWAVFVRQIELYEESGGNLADSIERSVKQVNIMLQLQAEARADYAIQDKQHKLILLIITAALSFWLLLNPEKITSLISTPLGIAGLVIGCLFVAFGTWFLQKQLKDVERKMAF